MNRIFVVRVGADTSYYPLKSPVFEDYSFEFVPIWEGKKTDQSPIAYKTPMLRYCDIACFNNPNDTLAKYVPKYLAEKVAHNDPEFRRMTYGDLCETYPRASNLKAVKQGDYLFFLARLEPHDGKRFVRSTAVNSYYFIGYFHIELVCGPIEKALQAREEVNIGSNAHVLRAKADPSLWVDKSDRFWVFKGGADSRRFCYALKAEYDWLSKIFSDAQGHPWRENSNQTPLQRMMSYTRTVRCQIDLNVPQQKDSYNRFWEKIQQHLRAGRGIV